MISVPQNYIRFGRYLLLAPLIFSMIYAGFTQVDAADIFWHLKMGKDFLFNGLNPLKDHYSIAFLGSNISFLAWPFQFLAALFSGIFGDILGLQILRIFLWSIPVTLFHFWLVRKKAPLSTYFFLMTGLVATLTYRRLLRPELCSYGILLAYILIYLENRKKPSIKILVAMIPVQILWNNIHIVSLMGYIVLAGLYLDYFIAFVRSKDFSRAFKIVGLWCLTLAIDFVNPWMQSGILAALNPYDWSMIEEFSHLNFWKLPVFLQALLYLSLPLALYLVRERAWGGIFILIVFITRTWAMEKILIFYGVMVLPFLLQPLLDMNNRIKKPAVQLIFMAILCLLPLHQLFTRTFLSSVKPSLQLKNENYPVELSRYKNGDWASGKIFNDLDTGGYLLYQYGPELKVLIDGRTNILYPHAYFIDFLKSFYGLDEFKALDDKLQFDWVLDRQNRANTPLDNALESGRFAIDYLTPHFVLLKRSQDEKALRTSLLFRFPQCMKKEDPTIMASFLESQPQLSQEPTPLSRFAAFAKHYWASEDSLSFLKGLTQLQGIEDAILRASAYQALKLNDPELALYLWQRAQGPLPRRDLFQIVDILCEQNNCKNALAYLKANTKEYLPYWARLRLKKQYDLIKSKNLPSETLPTETLEKFNQRTALPEGFSQSSPEPDPCT